MLRRHGHQAFQNASNHKSVLVVWPGRKVQHQAASQCMRSKQLTFVLY